MIVINYLLFKYCSNKIAKQVESSNAWLTKLRNLPPFAFFDRLVLKMTAQRSTRRRLALLAEQRNKVLVRYLRAQNNPRSRGFARSPAARNRYMSRRS